MSTACVIQIVQPVGYQAVRTLRSLCIHVIRDLIISYVQSLSASNRASLPDALFVISPFDCLPSRCVQDVINLLAEEKQLNMTLLSVLIHAHLTTLDLSILIQDSSKFFKPKFFELIASRCTELLHLKLGISCKMMGGKHVLRSLLSNNEYVRTLILCNFRPIDDIIPRINRMQYLTTLDVSNSQLSDAGVTLLTSQERPLPDLTSLNVSNTEITSFGVQSLFSKFPSLRELDLSFLELTLPFMNFQPHGLTCLTLLNTDILPDNLYTLLLALLQLQWLELYPCHSCFIDKDGLWDVLPVLTNISYFSTYRSSLKLANSFTNRLVHLSLPCSLSRLSAPLLCTLFPSLQYLNVDDCKIADGAISPGIAWNSTQLVSLSLTGATFIQTDLTTLPGQDMLAFIGSFGNLENLDLSRTDVFPQMLLNLLRETTELKLTQLTLNSCHKLNKSIIKFLSQLAHTCTHRCCVDLSYCFNVAKSHLEKFRDSLTQATPPVQHGISVNQVYDVMSTTSWSYIACKQSDLFLEAILQCGQAFGWRRSKGGIWFGVLKDRIFLLKQSESSLLYQTLPDKTYSDSEEVLLDYFRLREDMDSCYKEWSERDKKFREAHKSITGIRILRQDPVESVFSFICSSANNTLRISQLVLKLCLHFGEQVGQFEDVPCHSFPQIEDLAREGVREKLVSLGFGYRSRYLHETAVKLRDEFSRSWLVSLRGVPYLEAADALLQFPGVGKKVADCICLMSLDKLEAVPMDTHAIQIANRDYGLKLHSKSITKAGHKKAGDFFRELYGDRAGWAQTILFVRELKVVQKLYEDTPSSGGRKKRKPEQEDVIGEKKIKLE